MRLDPFTEGQKGGFTAKGGGKVVALTREGRGGGIQFHKRVATHAKIERGDFALEARVAGRKG